VSDILSVESTLELNDLLVKSGISSINSSSERVANSIDSNDTTTRSLETSAVECGTSVEDVAASGRRLDRHSLTLGVRTGVTTGSKDNGGAELVLNGKLAVVEVAVGTSKHDLSQISIGREKRKDGLCFRVTESDVVLKDLRSLAGDHETSEENTTERLLLSSHTGDSGLENLTVDELSKLLGSNVCRRIASHATSVRALVSIEDALVVLSERQRSDSVAVAESQNTELITNEKLFYNNLVASVAELLVNHNLLQSSLGLLLGLGKDNTLSSSETSGLDNDVMVDAIDVCNGLVVVGEVLISGSRNIVLLHEILGVGLAALKSRSFLGGTEAGNASLSEPSLNTVNERSLRARNNKVDAVLLRKLDKTSEILSLD